MAGALAGWLWDQLLARIGMRLRPKAWGLLGAVSYLLLAEVFVWIFEERLGFSAPFIYRYFVLAGAITVWKLASDRASERPA